MLIPKVAQNSKKLNYGSRTVNRGYNDNEKSDKDKEIEKIREKYPTRPYHYTKDIKELEDSYGHINNSISYDNVVNNITTNIQNFNSTSKYITISPVRGITEIDPILSIIQSYGGVICGGYATHCASFKPTHIAPGDIDIYCKNFKSYEYIVKEFKFTKSYGSYKISETPFYTSFKFYDAYGMRSPFGALPSIQVINPNIYKNIYGRETDSIDDVKEILNNFDFTVCRAAILDKKTVLVDERWIVDEDEKNIRIVNLTKPVGLFSRVIKYISKGYKINPSEILKLFVFWDSFDQDSKKLVLNCLMELTKLDIENENNIKTKNNSDNDETEDIFNIGESKEIKRYNDISQLLIQRTRKELGYKYDVFAQHVILKNVEKAMSQYVMGSVKSSEHVARSFAHLNYDDSGNSTNNF